MTEIRSCNGFDEMQACVQLQIEIWGYDESDVTPRKTFMLAQKIGGQVIGAFDSESGAESSQKLVGFAMSLPGIKQTQNGPQPYLHSHMLAVRPSHRNCGLGEQLKWEQRREALSRGIRRMEWTFDPLVISNAFLNIHRLGTVSSAYLVDFYGVSYLVCRVGCQPTDFWRNGSWIPLELRRSTHGARQRHRVFKIAFWCQLQSTDGRPANQAAPRLSRSS
jgi:predicted GNAT superfamily acetyltransferase